MLSQRPAIVAAQQSALTTQVSSLQVPAQQKLSKGASTSQSAPSGPIGPVPWQTGQEVMPSFVAGYQDGLPVYSAIRILPPDQVALLSDESSESSESEWDD